MKRRIFSVLLMMTSIGIIFAYFNFFSVSSNTIEVTLTSTFDETNIITTVIDVGDGLEFSLDENIEVIDNYSFEFYIVDGLVKEDLLIDNVFSITKDSQIQAVFVKDGEAAALFVDLDGKLLNVQYVRIGNDALSPIVEYPLIEGYEVSLNPWASTLSNISESSVFTLHYEEVISNDPEEVEVYSAGFEDASKRAYAAGLVSTYGGFWTLDDALIGSLDSDNKNGAKAVRIRNGFMVTEFAIENLYRISFELAKYSEDDDSTVSLAISTDKETWTIIDNNIEADSRLDDYEFILTDALYIELGLDNRDSYYIKIISDSADNRVNIDDVVFSQIDYKEEEVIIVESSTMSIYLPIDLDKKLSLGDEWLEPVCTAFDTVIGEVACTVTGEVDTSNIGGYEVTYSAVDGEGLSKTIVVEYVVFRDESLLEIDYTGYYDGIEGLYGEELVLALREILNDDLVRKTYDEARYILDEADVDPNNPDNVILIYTRDSVSGIWDGETWHREHVWPNSRLGVERVDGSDYSIASDLHNLRAVDPGENSSRSNEVFGLVDTPDVYLPHVDATGDVSRIIFYMAVMYEQLELVNYVLPNDVATNYLPAGAKMSVLDHLISWHYSEEVDQFEINRNNVIYSYQNNRNPFIDFPYLVELVWYQNDNIPE